MIIEGHFSGTRAKHYTDRDVEELRDVYGRAYPSIRLSVDEPLRLRSENVIYGKRFADIEGQLDRQRVLEARLTILEDKLDQLREASNERLRSEHEYNISNGGLT